MAAVRERRVVSGARLRGEYGQLRLRPVGKARMTREAGAGVGLILGGRRARARCAATRAGLAWR